MENFKIYDYKDKKVVLKYLIGFYINQVSIGDVF